MLNDTLTPISNPILPAAAPLPVVETADLLRALRAKAAVAGLTASAKEVAAELAGGPVVEATDRVWAVAASGSTGWLHRAELPGFAGVWRFSVLRRGLTVTGVEWRPRSDLGLPAVRWVAG